MAAKENAITTNAISSIPESDAVCWAVIAAAFTGVTLGRGAGTTCGAADAATTSGAGRAAVGGVGFGLVGAAATFVAAFVTGSATASGVVGAFVASGDGATVTASLETTVAAGSFVAAGAGAGEVSVFVAAVARAAAKLAPDITISAYLCGRGGATGAGGATTTGGFVDGSGCAGSAVCGNLIAPGVLTV